MIKLYTRRLNSIIYPVLFLAISLISFLPHSATAGVVVKEALGGTVVCTNSYTYIGDIYIYELNNNDFTDAQTNKTLILTCPAGFEFMPGMGGVTFASGVDITSVSLVVTSTTATVTMSTNGTPSTITDQIRIGGLAVRATSASPLAGPANILRLSSNPGTFAISGIVNDVTNFGTLTQTPVRTYNSSDVSQSTVTNVEINETSASIIGLKVNISGQCGNFNVTSITFNTNGSTDPSADIKSAKLYYTGSNPLFNTGSFLSEIASPNGSFTLPCNLQTYEGDNYFWLAYDIMSTATFGNYVDASCTSFILGGVSRVPSNIAPAGKRQIGISTITSNGIGGGLWNLGTTWVGGVVPTENNHVIIEVGDIVSMNADGFVNNLTVKNNSTLALGAAVLTIYGNISTVGSGDVTSVCLTDLNIMDRGTANVFDFPSGMVNMHKIELDRTSGASSDHDIYLSNCVSADSIVIILTNGILTFTGSNRLMLESKAIQTNIPSSAKAHVDGIVRRYITANNTFYFFPVGDNGMSRRYAVKQLSGGDSWHEVQFFNEQPPNYCCVKLVKLPGGILDQYYWRDRYAGVSGSGGNPLRRMYYADDDFAHLSTSQRLASLAFATNPVSSPTSIWDTPSSPWTVYDSPGDKYLQFQTDNEANQEYWTFGTSNPHDAILDGTLPIELLSFTATPVNGKVRVDWATASETNSSHYTIQRSVDAKTFEDIGRKDAAGFSTSRKDYAYIDVNPKMGISYYRILQTDLDGQEKVTEPKAVRIDPSTGSFAVYPNPVKGNASVNLNLEKFKDREITISMFGMLGRRYYTAKKTIASSGDYIQTINFQNKLARGIYFISVQDEDELYRKKIVVN